MNRQECVPIKLFKITDNGAYLAHGYYLLTPDLYDYCQQDLSNSKVLIINTWLVILLKLGQVKLILWNKKIYELCINCMTPPDISSPSIEYLNRCNIKESQQKKTEKQ